MRILVTGTDGYIGSVMGPWLQRAGFEVQGVDTGFYRNGWLCFPTTDLVPTWTKDIRSLTEHDVVDFDAVVHLAELSNDPLGELNPDVTYEVNHRGSLHLAKICQEAGVKRFVYASSCSVYGAGTGDWKSELSLPNPQTAYARCKVLVEQDVSQLADDNFSPTFLRNATAYGVSPRMRFDVVLNNLAGLAWTKREIRLHSDGSPWRPLVHIQDISLAVECVLRADREAIHNQVFNVGTTEENFQVREIADIVSSAVPGCQLSTGQGEKDNRSYRVNFDKIQKHLTLFRPKWTAERGAQELIETFRQIDMTDVEYQWRAYTRLKQLKHLCETGQVDENLFWRSAQAPVNLVK